MAIRNFFLFHLIVFFILLQTDLQAQVPQKIGYQAIVRDSAGELIVSQPIGLRVSVLQSSINGTVVYSEIHTLSTNANGLLSFNIGSGIPENGYFNEINWGNASYFIKTEIDIAGGTNYSVEYVTQLISVPYALHAHVADSAANIALIDGSETKIQSGYKLQIEGYGTQTQPYIISSTDTAIAIGDLQYWNGTDWQILSIGDSNQILSVNASGVPEWRYVADVIASQKPLLVATNATDIQSYSATLNGTANANGFKSDVQFEWGTTTAYGNIATATPAWVSANSNIPVSVDIGSLQSNTTYHFRIKAQNIVDEAYSNDATFTTLPSAPHINTTAASNIMHNSASSGGWVTYDGGSAVTARGVCWSTSQNPTLADNYTTDGSGTGTFSSIITGLNIGTTYYVRAYATNSIGTSYGSQVSFTTIDIPIVETNSITDIQGNRAKAGGYVTNNGGQNITIYGLCWSLQPNPTTNDSINHAFDEWMQPLYPDSVYYVRAYATNVAGTGYGNEVSFNAGKLFGTNHAGGLVFYNNGSGGGMAAADTVLGGSTSWGCLGVAIGTSDGLYTGQPNTTAILAGCGTPGIAADLCDDLTMNGYNDWFLPSKDELNLVYINLYSNGIGSFTNAAFLTSTEYNSQYPWVHFFNDGSQQRYYTKALNTFSVIGIRIF